ncbi:hypothetical protein N1851_002493 [Merluccius polli]|uniref:Tick transposon n=1 Tax=Merluccius polli TaxID=89951 RepID=A0AA47N9Z6_MERPO|nr:hypothetical protein N1851_002493 [Merluccius polli]
MEVVAVAADHMYHVTPERASGMAAEIDAMQLKLNEMESRIEVLTLRQRFGLHRLEGSNSDFRFFTRFASYQHFMAFWKLVEPAVNSKMVRITSTNKTASSSSSTVSHPTTKLPPIEELLLFLMHLSVGSLLQDLAERFSIHRSTASRIVSTWTHFLYCLLGSQRLWIPPEVVRAHLPPEFSAFADTHVVLDCTEIFCQTPSSLLLHSEVFSSYKSHTTFKAMIGMAPHGAITFVSGLYAGSMSDREIFKRSGITKLLQPHMAITVDKGFLVDNLAGCKADAGNCTSESACGEVHKEGKREQIIRHTNTSVCGNIEELFSVACFLVNYQNGPLVKAWATQQ